MKVLFKWIIQATQEVFYMIRLSTRENSSFLNMIPQKTPKQKKKESGFSAVSLLRSCGPLALIPVNGEKKRNREQNSDRKMTAVRNPGVAGW